MRKNALAVVFLFFVFIRSAHAFSVALNGGASTLPASSYKYFTPSAEFSGNTGPGAIFFHLGSTIPQSSFGPSTYTVFSSVGYEFRGGSSGASRSGGFFRPFGGAGVGAYADMIGYEQWGVVPAFVFRGGFRMGGKVGLQFGMDSYWGAFDIGHVVSRIVWPYFVFSAGIYLGS